MLSRRDRLILFLGGLFMNTMKKFTIGMAVLLVASLFLTGCPPEAEPETVYVTNTEVIHVDVVAKDEDELITALADDAVKVIELNLTADFVSLATVTEIPAGKTIILRGSNGKSLTPKATDGLTIKGTVYVELGGILVAKAANPVTVTGGGVLNVVRDTGTLRIDKAESVPAGAVINGGVLSYEAAPANIADVAAALGKVTKGTVYVGVPIAGSTPYAIAEGVKDAVSPTKELWITAAVAETETGTLTVPAGLVLTAKEDDTLATITGLVVNGELRTKAGTLAAVTALTMNGRLSAAEATLAAVTTLTVNSQLTADKATLAAVTALTVNGSLYASSATLAAVKTVTGTGFLSAGVVTAEKAPLVIESTLGQVRIASTAITDPELVIPENTYRIFTGEAAPSGTVTVNGQLRLAKAAPAGDVTVNGILQLEGDLTLKKTLAIGMGGTGRVDLVAGKKITLGAAAAKIVGSTAYEITPANGETTGTLTAGVANTKVTFRAAGIEGYYNSGGQALVAHTTDPTSAATLAFGGTAGPTLAIKGATTVGGVILDVSSKGNITVDSGQTLTLGLGAGQNHIASGGIFTKAGGVTTINAVKANGVQNGTKLNTDTAAGLGEAKIAATGAADSVQAASPASGVITGGTNTVIDKEDTFTVGANGAITVGHS
jgi:hypothetical protein